MHSFPLQSGASIPCLGFGLFNTPGEEAEALVKKAISVGYRHIDCASAYGNEKEVGAAFKHCLESGEVKREDLFVTSKLRETKHKPEDVRPAFMQTLKDLQLEYLDLYLIHWPVALNDGHSVPVELKDVISLEDCPLLSTWTEMEKLVDEGLVKSIGVSNFSVKKLHDLLEKCRIQPVVNQVECHVYCQVPDMHRYCMANNIHITGFSPLGSPARPEVCSKRPDEPLLMEDPVVKSIASKHKVLPSQVLLHWGIACGPHSVLCKASSDEHLKANLASVTTITLDEDDKARLKTLDKNWRFFSGEFWVAPGGYYTLENLWDEGVTADSMLELENKKEMLGSHVGARQTVF